MARWKLPVLVAEAERRNLEQLARLGGEVRASRERRRWTQKELGARAGLCQSAISDIERGYGGGYSLDLWQRLFLALDRLLIWSTPRDPLGEPADAGHLGMEELVLRFGKSAGFLSTFELLTRPATSRHSIDVFLRSDTKRLLVVCECWNTFSDLGAAARSFAWKLAQAEQVAVAIGGSRPYRVAGCWVVRASAANRALVNRYPEAFKSRLGGSSVGWTKTLTVGAEPPDEPGLVWCDIGATRLFAARHSR